MHIVTVISLAATERGLNEPHDKTSKVSVHPAKTQMLRLIRVFAVRMKKPWVLSYPLSAQRRLIRLGGCRGWSESSLGAHSLCWFCHVVAQMYVILILRGCKWCCFYAWHWRWKKKSIIFLVFSSFFYVQFYQNYLFHIQKLQTLVEGTDAHVFLFFYLGFTARQDYFTHFELSQW